MKFRFYGHNCFFLKGSKVSVLSDPWLSDKGAFFGSWFQWPINHQCATQLVNELVNQKRTILYISHEHQDHFDKETLNLILPHIEMCVIPKYSDCFLKNELKSIGYEVVELEDQKRHYFTENDYIELMIVDTGVNHDSTAIVRLDDKIFVNQNDCKIFDRLTYLEDKQVDYYSVQFSGATWHPVCYSMGDDEKKKISKKKVLSKLVAVRNAVKILQPKYYLPSAGPAIFPFLREDLSLGIDNIFVHQPDIANLLKNSNTKIVCLQPGEEFNQGANTVPISPPTSSQLKNLRQQLNCMFLEYDEHKLDIDALKSQISLRLEQIKALKFAACPSLIFTWGDNGLDIVLSKGTVSEIRISNYNWPSEYMCVEAPPAYFGLMANAKYRWQDIYLSLRATVHRKPDIFNTFINIFLFSDVENIRSGFETTLNINDERIVVVNPNNGKNYEINRFCPHNGADLKDAKIDDQGNLICPRHSWLFNLERSGRCSSAEASVEAKEILNTITLCETFSTRLLKIDN